MLIKHLLKDTTQAVVLVEALEAPDVLVLKWLEELSSANDVQLERLIVVSAFSVSHKRLLEKEHLQILFLIHKRDSAFVIEKICIQKNLSSEFPTFLIHKDTNTFENYLNAFEPAEGRHVLTWPVLLKLNPIFIPKPWGQEIWYSGIEARGVSGVEGLDPAVKPRDDMSLSFPAETLSSCNETLSSRGLTAGSMPLSWLVGTMPTLTFGKKYAQKDPILIKILDPSPHDVKGDLYYELHLEKNEVYVVTAVANERGKIKIGINSEKFKLYSGDTAKFKDEFLKSILDYETIRRTIDDLLEHEKPVSNELTEQEHLLRKNMDSFCGYVDLHVGDVINVPTHMPHALQNGVQVIEFQTPTYERLIISFAQKVLTQTHWDTIRAFEHINLKSYEKPTLSILSDTKFVLKELVCSFPDFEVCRWTLKQPKTIKIPKTSHYKILFVVDGNVRVDHAEIVAGTCVLIPAEMPVVVSCNEKAVCLMCEPKNNTHEPTDNAK